MKSSITILNTNINTYKHVLCHEFSLFLNQWVYGMGIGHMGIWHYETLTLK